MKIVSVLASVSATAAVGFAGVCLLLMMGQTVADVGLRVLFNSPIRGNLEIVSLYHMVAVVFLPLAVVELRNGHINVDMIVARLSQRNQAWVYLFTQVLGAAFLSLLIYRTSIDAAHATHIGEIVMGSANIPVWPAKWMLPIGFAAMLLAVLANTAKAVFDPDNFDGHSETSAID